VKPFGAPLPVFTATFAGFVAGDTPASLAGTLVLATSAVQVSPVGSYPIVPSGVWSPNYAVAFVNGALTIVMGASAVSLSASPEPSGAGMAMTFAAAVAAAAPSAGTPGGTVGFYDGPVLVGTSALSGGVATLNTAGLDPGVHVIEARYNGDGSFEAGVATSSHAINTPAATPALAVSSSRNPSNVGQAVTLTASVTMTAGPVSGTVAFYDGASALGSAAIVAGRATLSIATLPAGSHAITARFLGSAAAPPAVSPVFVQAVGAGGWKNRATTTTVASSGSPAPLGGLTTFTATVAGQTAPAGRVLFMVDGLVVGDPGGVLVTPTSGSAGQATVTVGALAHGQHIVTATYLGDATYKGSTGMLTQVIN
jgi:hypothetical protein